MSYGYPRTCRNGHIITSPDDDYFRVGAGKRVCRLCRAATIARYQQTPNGRAKFAEVNAKYRCTTKGLVAVARNELTRLRKDQL